MRLVGLQVENFQKLQLVDISLDGDVIKIGGENEQGKTAVLNAIWVALAGRAVAPAMPIRKGEEECRIRLDLGELIVTRKLIDKGDGRPYTDSVKLESADGSQRYTKPQQVLDALMGQIGFDPFAFVQMKPDDQAETLLEMVPLSIDLEEFARKDTADFERRADVNRDIKTLDGQIAGIPERDDLPKDAPDRAALQDRLATAAETNGAIERERARRESEEGVAQRLDAAAALKRTSAAERRAEAARLIEEAERLEVAATEDTTAAGERRAIVAALPALDEPVDTGKLRIELAEAEGVAGALADQARRVQLVADRAAKKEQSDAFTKAREDRETARRDALAKAKMPIEGLEFAVNDRGKATVMFKGVPFAQASKAEQIKASTAIAMAANPELRVLRISDGSLLDKNSLALIASMAKDGDFQLLVEIVGTENVTLVIENGLVKGAAAPVKKAAAKKPAAGEGEEGKGPLL
jgi:hypothetical protein